MFHIGVTKIGSWSEYILLQTLSYWTCSAWKRLLDAVFSNVELPLWPVLYSGCGVSLGPCRLVGGRIEHAGNQPSVVSIHIYALAKFYKQIASKDHHSWKYLFTKHTQKQFLSFFWALGEVELFLRMLSNTPAALHYWLATSLKIVVYSITYTVV